MNSTLRQIIEAFIKEINRELSNLVKADLFWIVAFAIIILIVVIIRRAKSPVNLVNKIKDAIYDGTSIIMSLFYDIIAAITVFLNFIKTLTDLMFGDLSENLLKQLSAFAIIAFSVTSFFTTYKGMIQLFGDFFAALISFGVQTMILALVFRITYLIETKIKNYEDRKKVRNSSLVVITIFTLLPILVLLINAYLRGWQLVILLIFIAIAIVILAVIFKDILKKIIETIEGGNKPKETVTSIHFIILALGIFISSFFSYTHIFNIFSTEQINTDYLIYTASSSKEILEELDDKASVMETYLNDEAKHILQTLDGFFVIGYMSPLEYGDTINGNYESLINDLVNSGYSIIKSKYEEKLDLEDENLKIKEKIDNSDMTPAEKDNTLNQSEYFINQATINELKDEIGQLEAYFLTLFGYEFTLDNSENYTKFIVNSIVEEENYSITKTKCEKLFEGTDFEDILDEVDSFNTEFIQNEEHIKSVFGVSTEYFVTSNIILNDYKYLVDNIQNYNVVEGYFGGAEVADLRINQVFSDFEKLVAAYNRYNEVNNTGRKIDIEEYNKLQYNLKQTVMYYKQKSCFEDPAQSIDDILIDVFGGETKPKDGIGQDNSSDNEPVIVDERLSLKILQDVYNQILMFPNFKDMDGILNKSPRNIKSVTKIEKEVFDKMRIVSGEMKEFEKAIRKLINPDTYPGMPIFMMFIALIMDTAVAILFILKGVKGPFGDKKLNSKRVLYMYAVDNSKTPIYVQESNRGMKIVILSIIISVLVFLTIGVVVLVVNHTFIDGLYLLVFIFAGLIFGNVIASSYKRKKDKKLKEATNFDDYDLPIEEYGQFILKNDLTLKHGVDEFYKLINEEYKHKILVKNKSAKKFYNTHLYVRSIERLRERFFDNFVILLLLFRPLEFDNKDSIRKLKNAINEHTNNELNEETNIKYKGAKQTTINDYVAVIDEKDIFDLDCNIIFNSLSAYDASIILRYENVCYISKKFFKYVNELLWSRNSQYTNYGLDYNDGNEDLDDSKGDMGDESIE